jgi:spore maturation protein CgeB
MTAGRLRLVVLGLSITSSWGNGHATTYRALLRALAARGHDVCFLERDVPWYAEHRDLPNPPYGRTLLYTSVDELVRRAAADVRDADCVVVGSYVPEGIAIGDWVLETARGVRAFYDIDTPVTLAALDRGDATYVSRAQIPRYDLYLSFTGGPALERLQDEYGSPLARPLYCSFDPATYYPTRTATTWELGYMGTYSADRQAALERRLFDVARAEPRQPFVVAGAEYPPEVVWPANVSHLDHVPPGAHRAFYAAQRFTLNITRSEMVKLGYSPSVRLFEAAACGTAIVSDWWDGLDAFLEPQREVLIAESAEEVARVLRDTGATARQLIAARARARVLQAHTARHRAEELEAAVDEARRTGTGARAS